MDGFNIDNYLRISLTDVVLVCISTFLIVMIAKKFFWDKLLTLISKRQALIQENIDSSVQLKKEAEDIKEQYVEKMKNAGKEAHSIIESARAEASEEKQQILQQTQNASPEAQGGSDRQGRVEQAESSFSRILSRHAGMNLTQGLNAQAGKLKELADMQRNQRITERLAALKAAKEN